MLYLASKSPRRRELLEQLGPPFRALDVDVPEWRAAGESPQAYVHRVSLDKARAGLAAVAGEPDAAVLAGDTEVVLDGEVFGKPQDAASAVTMLGKLSGRVHEVVSSLWLATQDREESAQCVSRVTFETLDAATMDSYIGTGEFHGKAGGYAIQGRAAAFITHLDGSYSAVMGLPLHETAVLLRRFGMWPT